jgi:hypothetical protein
MASWSSIDASRPYCVVRSITLRGNEIVRL